jgi:hypothetical protein
MMSAKAAGSHGDVKRGITDFLRHIYVDFMNHIKIYPIMTPKDWSSANVEFVFSVPTTWESPEIIEDFRKIIIDAGCGCEGLTKKIHSVSSSITETSGAVVCTLKDCSKPLQKSQSFIVCNAGGVTAARYTAKLFLPGAPFSKWWNLSEKRDSAGGDLFG